MFVWKAISISFLQNFVSELRKIMFKSAPFAPYANEMQNRINSLSN